MSIRCRLDALRFDLLQVVIVDAKAMLIGSLSSTNGKQWFLLSSNTIEVKLL